jgi:hypothetical protein
MIRSIFFAALVSCAFAASAPFASATPLAPKTSPGLDAAQQAHSVRICDRDRCWWSRDHHFGDDHWGYGRRWRGDRWHRDWDDDDRDWDR